MIYSKREVERLNLWALLSMLGNLPFFLGLSSHIFNIMYPFQLLEFMTFHLQLHLVINIWHIQAGMWAQVHTCTCVHTHTFLA